MRKHVGTWLVDMLPDLCQLFAAAADGRHRRGRAGQVGDDVSVWCDDALLLARDWVAWLLRQKLQQAVPQAVQQAVPARRHEHQVVDKRAARAQAEPRRRND